jgi:hypothetical protein
VRVLLESYSFLLHIIFCGPSGSFDTAGSRTNLIFDAFSWRHGPGQAPPAIWPVLCARVFELFPVTGLPVLRGFLTGVLCRETRFDRARGRFSYDQSPAQQRQRRRASDGHR